jgi:hypothetical protein
MEQTNYELAMEVIGEALDGLFLEQLPKNNKSVQVVNNLLSCTESSYILVEWPESQNYMEEEWFDEEAIFCGGSEDKTGGSAYFIPIKYVI